MYLAETQKFNWDRCSYFYHFSWLFHNLLKSVCCCKYKNISITYCEFIWASFSQAKLPSLLLFLRMINQFIWVKNQFRGVCPIKKCKNTLVKTPATPAFTSYSGEKAFAFILSYSASFSSFAVELPIFA